MIVTRAALCGCERPQTTSTWWGCHAWTILYLQPVCRLLAGKTSLSLSISTLPVHSIPANARRNRLNYKITPVDNYSPLVLGNETRRRQNGSLSSLPIRTTTRRLHYLFFHLKPRPKWSDRINLTRESKTIKCELDHVGGTEILMHHNGNIFCSGTKESQQSSNFIPSHVSLGKNGSVAREKKKNPSIPRIRGGDRMVDGEAPINFMILCLRLPIEKNPSLIREPVGAVN